MRIEFKKPKIKEDKFIKFLKSNGADYYEDEKGIFIIPKKQGKYRTAIQLRKDEFITFGCMDESCNNFVADNDKKLYYPQEQGWIIGILEKTKKWVR